MFVEVQLMKTDITRVQIMKISIYQVQIMKMGTTPLTTKFTIMVIEGIGR